MASRAGHIEDPFVPTEEDKLSTTVAINITGHRHIIGRSNLTLTKNLTTGTLIGAPTLEPDAVGDEIIFTIVVSVCD